MVNLARFAHLSTAQQRKVVKHRHDFTIGPGRTGFDFLGFSGSVRGPSAAAVDGVLFAALVAYGFPVFFAPSLFTGLNFRFILDAVDYSQYGEGVRVLGVIRAVRGAFAFGICRSSRAGLRPHVDRVSLHVSPVVCL